MNERFADFFDKYGLRGQIFTKLELKLQIIVQYQMILGEILHILNFSTGFKALELAASFWVTRMVRIQSSAA